MNTDLVKSTISTRVEIEPEYISNLIHTHLLQNVKSRLEGKCTKNEGYIFEVCEITETNNITENVFYLKCVVLSFKPVIGGVYDTHISMIYNGGVFGTIHGRQRVLVPKNTEFSFNPLTKTGVICGRELSVGDVIQVRITAIKYSNREFSCIGEFKDYES